MTPQSPDRRTLSAYVDGELGASAAAAVAEAAGDSPAVAEQIATLYQLKGAAHAAFSGPPVDLGDIAWPPSRWWPRVVQAAAAVVLVAVLASGWLLVRPQQATLPAALLATARTLHADWLNADSGASAELPPATLKAALTQFRQLPVVPDLESAKLYVDRVMLAERPGGHVLQVGYRGTHGCHLSLFVFADANLPKTLVRLDIGTERAYGWQIHELGYLLFARGMDGARFDLIAHKVEQETRTRTPFDEGTRQALAESKKHSASCAA